MATFRSIKELTRALQHEKGYKSAKIGFFYKLKEEIEQKLHDKDISLDCYIITPTQAIGVAQYLI